MCGCSATGIFSAALGQGCAYTCYCIFPRSHNRSGLAGSSDFRRCAPVALGKPWPHHHPVVIIQLHHLRPRGWRRGGAWIRDLGLSGFEAGGVGGMCGERGCVRGCAGAEECCRGRSLAPARARAVLLPRRLCGVLTCGVLVGSSAVPPVA